MQNASGASSPTHEDEARPSESAEKPHGMSDKPGAGRVYVSWNAEEEEALRLGVLRHGIGAWQIILRDPEFKILKQRTGIQLKDKWRNLVKFNHLSREEFVMAAKSADRKWKRGGRGRDHDQSGQEAPCKQESPKSQSPKLRSGNNMPSPREQMHMEHVHAMMGAAAGGWGSHRHPRDSLMPPLSSSVDYQDRQDPIAHFGHIARNALPAGAALRDDEGLARWPSYTGYAQREQSHHFPHHHPRHHRSRGASDDGEDRRHPRVPRMGAEAAANPAALLPEGFDLSQKLGSDETYQLVTNKLSEMHRITPNSLGSPLEQACMWQQWAQWSEMQMAGLIELRMLLAESLQIQSEADNSLLDMVVRCRTGSQPMEQLQHTMKICDLANEKVQTAYKLMDVWRRKICTEPGPDELHVALAGQAAAQGRLQQQIEHVVRSMRR